MREYQMENLNYVEIGKRIKIQRKEIRYYTGKTI